MRGGWPGTPKLYSCIIARSVCFFQIGCFKILSEASVAAGIRRIEATTGYGVLNLLDDRTAELANTAVALKATT